MKYTLTLLALAQVCCASFVYAGEERVVLKQMRLLNQIPEKQLNDKTDPAFSILRALYDEDGPDFLTLRRLLGRADVRARLNPSVRCVLGGVVSQRWDAFGLSGNLYLSGLRSPNPDLRDKARKKLVCFLQKQHIPELIELLKVPGPNVLAYEILQEATGKRLDPNIKVWRKWWKGAQDKIDISGHLLNDTRQKLARTRIRAFDQERFWYLPEGVTDADVPMAKRSARDQEEISAWNDWVNQEVLRYIDDWANVKDLFDRIVHQPDPRVNKYLESLIADPGFGDYASVLLAWRSSRSSMPALQVASRSKPTVGRILARGSLGDRTALVELLMIMDRRQSQPLSYKIMNDETRGDLSMLRSVGIIPAEQAFELLCHRNFDFSSAYTTKEKRKAFKEAKSWLKQNATQLVFDRRRGYFTVK